MRTIVLNYFAAMAGRLLEFLSHLHSTAMVYLSLLLLQIFILILSITTTITNSHKRFISTTQYLNLIEQNNPTSRYAENLRQQQQQSGPGECAVCLSEFSEGESVRNLKCRHTFHKDCLDKWLQQVQYLATCPLCRTKVLPDEVVANYHRRRNQMDYDRSDEDLLFFFSALPGNTLQRIF